MAALLHSTLVECCHGLIRASGLDLHKERPLVVTLGAGSISAVHVLPGRGSTQHVLDLLELGVGPVADPPGDVVDVGAGGAREPETILTLLAL